MPGGGNSEPTRDDVSLSLAGYPSGGRTTQGKSLTMVELMEERGEGGVRKRVNGD